MGSLFSVFFLSPNKYLATSPTLEGSLEGWRAAFRSCTHIFLFYFSYSLYIEIHSSIVRVVCSAWKLKHCGGKGRKMVEHCLNGTVIICTIVCPVWGWLCIIAYPAQYVCIKWSTVITISVYCLLKYDAVLLHALRSF